MSRKLRLSRCVYPNLRKWMIDNKVTLLQLSGLCGMTTRCTAPIHKKLCGERDFKLHEIRAIIKETGYTFEYLFSTE